MKYLVFITIFFILLLPSVVFGICDANSFTIVYINGIFTPNRSDAENDTRRLQKEFGQRFTLTNIHFITGYNPSHLSGVADLVQAASQLVDAPISDYDFKNILLQIYPQVTTRKILLVGHSQGAFYANEMYGYLTNHGESKDSTRVYNIATPAYEIAGGGAYLTSQNDTVINAVREAAKKVGARQPLSANIVIPPVASDSLGHSFQDVYLANAAGRIISEIETSLGKLSAADAADNADGGCFTPPAKDFSYRAQQAFFAAADPMTVGVVAALDVSRKVKDIAAAMVEDTIVATAGEIKNVASAIFVFEAGTKISPVPAPDVSKETVHQTNDKAAAPARAEKAGTGNSGAVSVAKINDAGPISDSSSNAPDAVASVPTLDPAITNSGASGGGAAGSLGSISAPGAGAAPSDSVVSAVTGAAEQDQTPSSTASTTPAAETSTSTPAVLPAPDTTPPDISFAIPECSAASISDDGCLLTSPTINLSWTSTADDTNHFTITCAVDGAPCADFSFAPTNATATEYVLSLDGKTYTFTAQAIDTAGNASDTVAKTVAFSALPVVINEVAWMGTGSSATTSKDEWLELYNATDETIALSDWALSFYAPATTTPSHTITLSGTIPAKGFYLIERTSDTAVADVAADLVSSFGTSGLLNSGMIVKLERAGAVIDRTPELCGATWCAGSSSTYQTMERIDPAVSGEVSGNWGTALGEFILNGTTADGGTVKGTPKKRNSLNYLIAQGGALLQSKTLTKAHSPYLIARPGLTVSSGVVLTVDAGVVVKFVNTGEPSLVVGGTIQTNGTADEPVVFTSFLDDAYGGDMNADGMCDAGNASSTAACPSPGDWKQVDINSSGGSSHFDHTLFRYGGRWYSNMTIRAMVVADGASPAFSNATFAYSQKHGLYLNNSSSSVTGNVFSNNNVDADAAGLVIAGGAPSIQQSTFSANSIGLSVSGGASPAVSGNTFSGNTGDAIAVASSRPQFSGNSASGNGTNGIRFSNGPGAGSGGYTFAKDLPYVISGNFILPAGETFTIQPGVLFKQSASAAWDIHGTLTAEGTAEEPIIITSLADDDYGGDTNNDATTTAAVPGDWSSLIFTADSVSSTLQHAFVRYGSGYIFCGFSGGAVMVSGTSVDIADAVFEKNKAAGLWLTNSASTTVSATTFRDHQGSDCAVGLRLTGSHAMLDGVSFVHNRLGILAESSSTVTLGEGGVTFTGNTASTSPENLVP